MSNAIYVLFIIEIMIHNKKNTIIVITDNYKYHTLDIDECENPASCPQICKNHPGSYECSCFDGYEKDLKNRTICHAKGKPNKIPFPLNYTLGDCIPPRLLFLREIQLTSKTLWRTSIASLIAPQLMSLRAHQNNYAPS